MKKVMTIFVVILFSSLVLTNCGGGNSNDPSATKESETINEKPKLCDCQNYYWKDIEDAMNTGVAPTNSDFVNKCQGLYTEEEIIDADCGIDRYDPEFKAE
jgi:hypothetical protein